MRITKHSLRGIKAKLEEYVKWVHTLTDEAVVAELNRAWPASNPYITPETRERNIKICILLAISDFIPDHMIM